MIADSATRFLRLPEVMAQTGLRKTKIYAMINEDRFPAPVKIGRTSVWPECQVREWQRSITTGTA